MSYVGHRDCCPATQNNFCGWKSVAHVFAACAVVAQSDARTVKAAWGMTRRSVQSEWLLRMLFDPYVRHHVIMFSELQICLVCSMQARLVSVAGAADLHHLATPGNLW